MKTFEHRFVFEIPDKSYPYEVLLRVNEDGTRSIATPQDIAQLIDDVAERVEQTTVTEIEEAECMKEIKSSLSAEDFIEFSNFAFVEGKCVGHNTLVQRLGKFLNTYKAIGDKSKEE